MAAGSLVMARRIGVSCAVCSPGIAVGALQIWLAGTCGWSFLPQHTAASIILLSFGALLGDMGKSFIKRRLGKNRGDSWPIADQYDLVVGAFVMMLIFDPGGFSQTSRCPSSSLS